MEMSVVVLDTKTWAETTFGGCELGDRRRTERLVKLAEQCASRPDGSTPDQTESWADCKAAYRLFDEEDVTFDAIIAPHTQQTRQQGEPGEILLLVNDTTQVNYGLRRQIRGVGRTGKGFGQGFFLHSAMMMNAGDGCIRGMAGQILFLRGRKRPKQEHSNTRRRSPDRESVVWGNLVDQVGSPPPGVKWVHVNDRGSDDFEVFCRILAQRCDFVIRAGRLTRKVLTSNGKSLTVDALLQSLPSQQTIEVQVPVTKKTSARIATMELRYVAIQMPMPSITTPWLAQHRPKEPLRLWMVELREIDPPPKTKPLRWVLYTSESVTTDSMARTIVAWYERRPQIEDYHKALKTGCRVESRYYHTGDRLQRVTALLSVVAMRLMQLKTAARETPHRPAAEVAPKEWIRALQLARKKQANPNMTVREFLRAVAGLGGHLGRKCDGEPGWITVWRGFEKLILIARATSGPD